MQKTPVYKSQSSLNNKAKDNWNKSKDKNNSWNKKNTNHWNQHREK